MKKLLAVTSLVVSLFAAPVTAQQCISLKDAERIIYGYGMDKVSEGRVPAGTVVTYANPNTGQYIITLETDVASCLIVTGEGFVVYGYGVRI